MATEKDLMSGPDPTMYDIIYGVASLGRDAWTMARKAQRPYIRRILHLLHDLSDLTGWQLDTLPGRLGCNYVDLDLRRVPSDVLDDSADFLDGLVRLLDDIRTGGCEVTEGADLVINAHAAARQLARRSGFEVPNARPGQSTLAITVVLVADASTPGKARLEEIAAAIVDGATNVLRSGSVDGVSIYSSDKGSPLWEAVNGAAPIVIYRLLDERISMMAKVLEVELTLV